MAKSSLVVFMVALLSCSVTLGQKPADYVTNYVNNKPYYHIMHSLKKEDITFVDELTKDQFYENGGQFEIHIDKASFPVRSPMCKSNIIVRMPWVDNSKNLDQTFDLYNSIASLHKNNSSGKVDVAIELNPYVSSGKQGAYLTQCNVFFRHGNGHYIPNTLPYKL